MLYRETPEFTNVLQYLERSELLYKDKYAVRETDSGYSYSQLGRLSRMVGSAVSAALTAGPGPCNTTAEISQSSGVPCRTTAEISQISGAPCRTAAGLSQISGAPCQTAGGLSVPIGVIAGRRKETLPAFFGCLYAGCYYVPLDPSLPEAKLWKIINDCRMPVILGMEAERNILPGEFAGKFLALEDILNTPASDADIQPDPLPRIQSACPDTDTSPASAAVGQPLYMVYTSGSTGMPKGVLKSHAAMIDFIESYVKRWDFKEDECVGSQTPFFFDASAKDIYLCLRSGATLEIIPDVMFTFTPMLIRHLNERQVTFISWVPSALSIITQFNTFEEVLPETLRKVFFVGEAFPVKQFKKWQSALPDIEYVNLYGSSEMAGVCCCYKVPEDLGDIDRLPIGKPLPNCRVFLIDSPKDRDDPSSLHDCADAASVHDCADAASAHDCADAASVHDCADTASAHDCADAASLETESAAAALCDESTHAPETFKIITEPHKTGEIFIESAALAEGYFNDPEKTARSFFYVRENDDGCLIAADDIAADDIAATDKACPDADNAGPDIASLSENCSSGSSHESFRIFRTGDYAWYDENGDLNFAARSDGMIKHMGQRVELGEIESICQGMDEIEKCCCLYDQEKKRIYLFCQLSQGCSDDQKSLYGKLKNILVSYMLPQRIVIKDQLPLNANGKINRQLLKSIIKDGSHPKN